MHDPRNAHAQNRYEKLTGWKALATGGPATKHLTPEQRELDREVRHTINQESGHDHETVVSPV